MKDEFRFHKVTQHLSQGKTYMRVLMPSTKPAPKTQAIPRPVIIMPAALAGHILRGHIEIVVISNVKCNKAVWNNLPGALCKNAVVCEINFLDLIIDFVCNLI